MSDPTHILSSNRLNKMPDKNLDLIRIILSGYENKKVIDDNTTKVKLKIPHPTAVNHDETPAMIKIIAEVANDKLNGKCEIKYKNHINYPDWRDHYAITCHFVDNVLNGSYVEEHYRECFTHSSSTYIITCSYNNGTLDGEYTYTNNDIITAKHNYVNGKRHGPSKSCYTDGTPWIETTYINGKQNGKYSQYYQGGKMLKKYISNLTNGKEDGVVANFSEDGELISEAQYCMGILHGISKTYYHHYNMVLQETYDNGTLTGSEKFNYDGIRGMLMDQN